MIHVKVRWLWEKQHKLLLQHITSRGSWLATRHPPPLREGESSPPLLPRRSCLLQPWSEWGWGHWEDSPCWMLQDLAGPSQGCAALFDRLLPQRTELPVPFDPVLLHKNSMQFYVWWCAPAPLPLLRFQLSRSQPWAQDKTLRGVVNVSMMWSPVTAACTHWSMALANKDVAVVDFSLNGAYWMQGWAFCFMKLRGR